MKFFKSADELNVRDLTEVIRISSVNMRLYPDIYRLIGQNFKPRVLDVLLFNGILSQKEYSKFLKRDYINYGIFANGIVVTILEKLNNNISRELLRAYIAAIIIMSDKKALNDYFSLDMTIVGAVDIPTNLSTKDIHKEYVENFEPLTDEEWESLVSLSI